MSYSRAVREFSPEHMAWLQSLPGWTPVNRVPNSATIIKEKKEEPLKVCRSCNTTQNLVGYCNVAPGQQENSYTCVQCFTSAAGSKAKTEDQKIMETLIERCEEEGIDFIHDPTCKVYFYRGYTRLPNTVKAMKALVEKLRVNKYDDLLLVDIHHGVVSFTPNDKRWAEQRAKDIGESISRPVTFRREEIKLTHPVSLEETPVTLRS